MNIGIQIPFVGMTAAGVRRRSYEPGRAAFVVPTLFVIPMNIGI